MSLPAELNEFFCCASKTMLEDFELASMERASKLAKQLKWLLEQWVSERVNADVARLLIENDSLRSIRFDHRQESFNFSEGEFFGMKSPTSNVQTSRANVAAD